MGAGAKRRTWDGLECRNVGGRALRELCDSFVHFSLNLCTDKRAGSWDRGEGTVHNVADDLAHTWKAINRRTTSVASRTPLSHVVCSNEKGSNHDGVFDRPRAWMSERLLHIAYNCVHG